MGRRKGELTPEQIAERRARWWGEERNARRRARYKADADYREKTIKAVKTRYRVVRQEQGAEVRDDDAAANLAKLRMIGQVREVRLAEDRVVRVLSFTVEEIAKTVDRNPQVIYRWLQNGLLPPAVYQGRNMRSRWHTVYTGHEARAIMMVFSAHQKQSQYYREVHTHTRDRMFAAVREARANFTNQEWPGMDKETQPHAQSSRSGDFREMLLERTKQAFKGRQVRPAPPAFLRIHTREAWCWLVLYPETPARKLGVLIRFTTPTGQAAWEAMKAGAADGRIIFPDGVRFGSRSPAGRPHWNIVLTRDLPADGSLTEAEQVEWMIEQAQALDRAIEPVIGEQAA